MEDAGTSGVKLGMVPWSPNLIAAKDPAEQRAGTEMGTGGGSFCRSVNHDAAQSVSRTDLLLLSPSRQRDYDAIDQSINQLMWYRYCMPKDYIGAQRRQ